MLLAVNAKSPFTELCNGWTKCVCIFSTDKSRVALAMFKSTEVLLLSLVDLTRFQNHVFSTLEGLYE